MSNLWSLESAQKIIFCSLCFVSNVLLLFFWCWILHGTLRHSCTKRLHGFQPMELSCNCCLKIIWKLSKNSTSNRFCFAAMYSFFFYSTKLKASHERSLWKFFFYHFAKIGKKKGFFSLCLSLVKFWLGIFTACYVEAKHRLTNTDLLSLLVLMWSDRLAGIENYIHATNHPLNTTKHSNS